MANNSFPLTQLRKRSGSEQKKAPESKQADSKDIKISIKPSVVISNAPSIFTLPIFPANYTSDNTEDDGCYSKGGCPSTLQLFRSLHWKPSAFALNSTKRSRRYVADAYSCCLKPAAAEQYVMTRLCIGGKDVSKGSCEKSSCLCVSCVIGRGPCMIGGALLAIPAAGVGALQDCRQPPPEESMDITASPQNLLEDMEDWLNKKNIGAIFDFCFTPGNINYLQDKYFFNCVEKIILLAISHPDKTFTLEQRKQLLSLFMYQIAVNEIIRAKPHIHTETPLAAAMLSTYERSPQLLEYLCSEMQKQRFLTREYFRNRAYRLLMLRFYTVYKYSEQQQNPDTLLFSKIAILQNAAELSEDPEFIKVTSHDPTHVKFAERAKLTPVFSRVGDFFIQFNDWPTSLIDLVAEYCEVPQKEKTIPTAGLLGKLGLLADQTQRKNNETDDDKTEVDSLLPSSSSNTPQQQPAVDSRSLSLTAV